MSKKGFVANAALAASFALLTIVATIKIASALKPQVQPATEAVKKLDQLIEKNRTLEQRNNELMKQINALHQSHAAQGGPTLDQLIEKNGKLQQHNIDLMKRMNSLRQSLAK
jgi:sugar diacid utilization regulator